MPDRARTMAIAVFRRLAEAEGAVHGQPFDAVHFHEVGAIDAIVDIVGTCLGLDWLGVDRVVCSPLPFGGGTVRAAHGRLPVPVPAVVELWKLRGVPTYYNGIDRELVTPTGAALMTTLAEAFGPPPPMVVQTVGIGAGTIDLPLPNAVRLWIAAPDEGQTTVGNHAAIAPPIARAPTPSTGPDAAAPTSPPLDAIAVLETQIDDQSPQAIAYTLEKLLEAGARDAFAQPVTMKKGRLGTALRVVCSPDLIDRCEAILFQETTTIGVRRSLQQRRCLSRRLDPVETPYGPIRVKVAWSATAPDRVLNVHPEYDDVADRAAATGTPWQTVHDRAIEQWHTDRRPPAIPAPAPDGD